MLRPQRRANGLGCGQYLERGTNVSQSTAFTPADVLWAMLPEISARLDAAGGGSLGPDDPACQEILRVIAGQAGRFRRLSDMDDLTLWQAAHYGRVKYVMSLGVHDSKDISDRVAAMAPHRYEALRPVPEDGEDVPLASRVRYNDRRRWLRELQDGYAPVTGEDPDSVVYYCRKRQWVKIGTTKHLVSRMGQLKPDVLLTAEAGSYTRERELHRQFGRLRVLGKKEWFYANAAMNPGLRDDIEKLMTHIDSVIDRNGVPPAGWFTRTLR